MGQPQPDFDPEAFRATVREFLSAKLPEDLRHKVTEHKRLEKQDFLRWHEILRAQGWVAPNWPVEHGGTGWSVMQRHVFEEECAVAGAPETVPFGLRRVAPVIMAYGTVGQKSYYLPRILSDEDWWCQGYSEPGSGSVSRRSKPGPSCRAASSSSMARRPGRRMRNTRT